MEGLSRKHGKCWVADDFDEAFCAAWEGHADEAESEQEES